MHTCFFHLVFHPALHSGVVEALWNTRVDHSDVLALHSKFEKAFNCSEHIHGAAVNNNFTYIRGYFMMNKGTPLTLCYVCMYVPT